MLIGFDGKDLEIVIRALEKGENVFYKPENKQEMYQVVGIGGNKEGRTISYINDKISEDTQTEPLKITTGIKFYTTYEIIAELENTRNLQLILLFPELLKDKRVFLADSSKNKIPVKSVEISLDDSVDITFYDETTENRAVENATLIIKDLEEEEEDEWDEEEEW